MVRRSFRIGLRLGLLVGAAFALVKTVQSRRHTTDETAPPAPWEPLRDAADRAGSEAAEPGAADAPAMGGTSPATRGASATSDAASSVTGAPADEPVVDEVGEPVMEPAAPEEEPEPEPGLDVASPAPSAGTSGTSATDLGAPAGTPPETELLGTSVEPATDQLDPALDIVPEDAAPPVRPRRGPARKKAAPKVAAAKAEPWVDPEGGICPPTHPVKAKLKSRLFHLPGMFAYDRTNPDRCYSDADTAVADGFTSAKR